MRHTVLAVCFLSASLTALPLLLGLRGYAVSSGSMEPAIHKGAAVYIKKAEPSEIRKGDVITYELENGAALVTHRVTEVDGQRGTFVTKGDANRVADKKEVAFSRVRGVVVCTLPWGGYLMRMLSDPGKRVLLLGAFWLLLCLEDVGETGKSGKERNEKKEIWIHG